MKRSLKVLATVMMPMLLLACSSDNGRNENIATDSGRTLNFTDSLAFVTSSGDTAGVIAVAIADEPKEHARGLMYITNLGKDEGMLFIFEKEKPRRFWMANTPLSLDIIFVNAEKEIVRIHRSTPPFSHENFKSGEPALYAIEVNAGYTVAHDIKEGMEIRF